VSLTTIAWVDDEQSILEDVELYMQIHEMPVTLYNKSDEVISLIRQGKFLHKVVFTDIEMPGSTGVDIAKAISESHLDIVLYVASGSISMSLKEELKNYGVSAYFDKPLNYNDIIQNRLIA
jgi:DNA-binding NtrC family response regulator